MLTGSGQLIGSGPILSATANSKGGEMTRQQKYFLILFGLFGLVSGQVQATEITVDDGGDGTSGCSLAEAIISASTDTASGGCPAGSGEDTIYLETDVTLDTALPEIITPIIIKGQDTF
jgi:hypothetical protein